MLNGRYDEQWPFQSAIQPLYKLLREPKRLEVCDCGHIPPAEISAPVINSWLYETLGPVKHDYVRNHKRFLLKDKESL